MRALFEDLAFASTQKIWFEIREVGLPQNTNRRDIYFYVFSVDSAYPSVYAYLTRAQAQAAATAEDPGDDWIAKKEDINPASTSVTLDDNPANSPDLTDLQIQIIVSISGQPFTYHVVWCYTAVPDLVLLDNIRDLLSSHSGAGQALGGFTLPDGEALSGLEDESIVVGDPAREKARPFCFLYSAPIEIIETPSQGSHIGAQVPIIIQVEAERFGSLQDSWRYCRYLLGQVESIVFDENRTHYGIGVGVIKGDTDGPAPDEETGLLMVGRVTMIVELSNVWRDDVYPRY